MATINTSTYLDDGNLRTAGEAWTLNGAILTIRTDTRVHSDAPSSMSGSLGNISISSTLGGGVCIDATKVRWLEFDSGSGLVPSIGTTISQGSVSGYFLGVWENYTSAPLSSGSSMPASGFIKFREVTGGQFSSGVLVGISANAISSDKVGWIEIVERQTSVITVPRRGHFKTRGDWFEIGITSGNPGQIIQIPTNGGGANTFVPAIWIETDVSSGQYEIYNTVPSVGFITANLSTDERSKIVENLGNGQIRIGNNGTVNVGYTPGSGRKIRIPNIIGRQCVSGTDNINAAPNATLIDRPEFTTSSSGVIDIQNFLTDWLISFTSPYNAKIYNLATFDTLYVTNEANLGIIDNCAVSPHNLTLNTFTLDIRNNSVGGSVKNSKFFRYQINSNGHVANIQSNYNYDIENCHFGLIQYARNTGRAIAMQTCYNLNLKNIYQYNAYTQFSTCFNCKLEDIDHCDRMVGSTNSTTGMYVVATLSSCDNILVDGITFGLNNIITDYCSSYNHPVYSTTCSNITFRNGGNLINPLRCNPSAAPTYVAQDGGSNTNLKVQRIYLDNTRTNIAISSNTSKDVIFENLYGTVGSIQQLATNCIFRGCKSTSINTNGGSAVYGSIFFDTFLQDNSGVLWFAFNEPTEETLQYVSLSLLGDGGYTSSGEISMPTLGDEIIVESPYFILGHTGFANIDVSPTATNYLNFNYEYDIDKGNGYSNTWKTINTSNLTSEVVNPEIGFKLKIKLTTITENTTNSMRYLRFFTTSDVSAQVNLYPLDYINIHLFGYELGTRIQVYNLDLNEEVYNDVPVETSIDIKDVYTIDTNYRVRAMYQDGLNAKYFVEFEELGTAEGFSRRIVQEDNIVYKLNGINGEDVVGVEIDDEHLLVNVDTETLTWQDLYAYETYWLRTEEGIRDESRFITAIDQANYVFEHFKIKNVSSPSVPLVISNGYAKDSSTGDTLGMIDTTGGMIFSSPDRVVAFSIGSGLTTQQNLELMSINGNLNIINEGIKKSSILVPHNENVLGYPNIPSNSYELIQKDVSLYSTSWQLEGEIYKYNYIDSSINSNDIVDAIAKIETYDIAIDSELYPITETYNGGVYLWAKYSPISDIYITINIHKNV